MADDKLYLAEREEGRQKRRRRLRVVLLVLCFAGSLGGGLWLVFRSPLFAVQEIRVVGAVRMAPDDIRNFVEGRTGTRSFWGRLLGSQHLWAWDRSVPEEDLQTMMPNLRSLRIAKSYQTRIVTITVAEREPYGIWCFRKAEPVACFWFTADGTLFEPAPEAEGGLIRVVGDHSRESMSLGTAVLPSLFMENLRSVFRVVESSPLAVREMRYEDPALQEVRLVTYAGPAILFSLRFPAENTRAVIEKLIAQGGNGVPFPDLQYIDFRVENRAYYK